MSRCSTVRIFILLVSTFSSLAGIGCQLANTKSIESTYEMEPQNRGFPLRVDWVTKRRILKTNGIPRGGVFINSKSGWIFTDEGLSRTVDGGENWKYLGSLAIKGEKLKSIDFLDDLVGAAVVVKESKSNELQNEIRVWKTYDGGITWADSFSMSGIEFSYLTNDGASFWVLGLKYDHLSPICFNPLVLTSSGSEKSWIEDATLSGVLLQSAGKGCSNQAAMRFVVGKNKKIAIVTSGRVVFERDQQGGTWSKAMETKIHDDNAVLVGFGITDANMFWFVEGHKSMEHGMRGRLLLDEGRGEIHDAVTSDYSFADAVFISDQQFIICGAKNIESSNLKSNRTVELGAGAIFYTQDNGISYRDLAVDANEETFTTIVPKGKHSNSYWILGELGAVIEVSRKP